MRFSQPLSARRRRPSARLLAEGLEPRALLTMSPLAIPDTPPQPVAGVADTIVAATFTDSDTTVTPADFTATISWGDGSSGPGTISRAADGTLSVSGVKTYASVGQYPLAVTVKADDGETATLGVPSVSVISEGDPAFWGTRGVFDDGSNLYTTNFGSGQSTGSIPGFVSVFLDRGQVASDGVWTIPMPLPASGPADPTASRHAAPTASSAACSSPRRAGRSTTSPAPTAPSAPRPT